MNLQSTKHQEYTYTAQSAHDTNAQSSNREEAAFWVQPPDNSISIEYIYVDIMVRFDSRAPLSECKITRIGVMEYTRGVGVQDRRFIDVDFQADANYELKLQMNLSSMLVESHVSSEILAGENNIPFVNFPEESTYIDTSGEFDEYFYPQFVWWKQDALYTTVGQP